MIWIFLAGVLLIFLAVPILVSAYVVGQIVRFVFWARSKRK